MSWVAVAKKDFRDAGRSKGLWALTILFTLLVVGIVGLLGWGLVLVVGWYLRLARREGLRRHRKARQPLLTRERFHADCAGPISPWKDATAHNKLAGSADRADKLNRLVGRRNKGLMDHTIALGQLDQFPELGIIRVTIKFEAKVNVAQPHGHFRIQGEGAASIPMAFDDHATRP